MAIAPTEVCPPEIRFISGQPNEGIAQMIVIGADTHKATHTFAAVQEQSGRIIGTRTVRADADGLLEAWQWAHSLSDASERVWALEDCRHVSGRLERMLIGQGERVVRVAPRLTGELRRGERRPGKSDEIDAVAAARAAIREGIENLPVAFLDEEALEIRLLNDYRAQLVCERTRHQNRLRWHLVDLDPELEQRVPDRALAREQWVGRINRRLACLPQTARVRIARDHLKRIRELTRSERELERELIDLIEAHRPDLLAEPGIGPITAATLIGRTAGAQRFPTDGHYARQAGAAPIPASSGNTQRMRLNRGGDRQLNAALHRIALTRARTCPHTRAYLDHKMAEGKSRAEAYRCLKRYIARRVWHLLTQTPDQRPEPAIAIHCNTPNSGLALT